MSPSFLPCYKSSDQELCKGIIEQFARTDNTWVTSLAMDFTTLVIGPGLLTLYTRLFLGRKYMWSVHKTTCASTYSKLVLLSASSSYCQVICNVHHFKSNSGQFHDSCHLLEWWEPRKESKTESSNQFVLHKCKDSHLHAQSLNGPNSTLEIYVANHITVLTAHYKYSFSPLKVAV